MIGAPLSNGGIDATGILTGYLEGKGPEALHGMDPNFQANLARFLEDNPNGLSIISGTRSVERQQQLWQQALAKYGSPDVARKWVAPPGRSMHNHGSAVDLSYEDDGARQWALQNAAKYNLTFPMGNEPWHVEPIGARGQPRPDVGADTQVASQPGGGRVQVASADPNFVPQMKTGAPKMADGNTTGGLLQPVLNGGGQQPPGMTGGLLGGGGDMGSMLSLIGMALLSAKDRRRPLEMLPTLMQVDQQRQDRLAQQMYDRQRDARDFGFRQTEAQRAQQNSDRGFGLQEKEFGQRSTYQGQQLGMEQERLGLTKQQMEKGEFTKIGEDAYGRPSYGLVNPYSGTIKTPNAGGQPSGGGGGVGGNAAPLDVNGQPIQPGMDAKTVRETQTKYAIEQGQPAKFDDVAKMRDEAAKHPAIKRYVNAIDTMNSMVDSAKNPSGASDLDFVYGIAKVYDPDSVVREGEMTMVKKTGSLPDNVYGTIQRVLEGKASLTPQQRADLLDSAATRVRQYRANADVMRKQYEGIAKRNRANPDDVLPELLPLNEDGIKSFRQGLGKPQPGPAPAPAAQPAPAQQGGQRLRYNPQTGELE